MNLDYKTLEGHSSHRVTCFVDGPIGMSLSVVLRCLDCNEEIIRIPNPDASPIDYISFDAKEDQWGKSVKESSEEDDG